MTDKPEIVINRYRRSVCCQGFAGSVLRHGFNGTERYNGMGDSVMLDFTDGFFAVADGTGRYSSAARNFLIMFAEGLQEMDFFNTDMVYSRSAAAEISRKLREETEKIISRVHYTENCTFTGFLLINTDEGRKAAVMHTGDSMLYKYSKDRGMEKITENNFWFIGRSQKLYQAGLCDLSAGEKLFLITDGLNDLNISDPSCLSVMFSRDAHEISENILKEYETRRDVFDDIAMISVDPDFNKKCSGIVIAGGTDKNEEELFYTMRSTGKFEDKYIPVTRDDKNSIILL